MRKHLIITVSNMLCWLFFVNVVSADDSAPIFLLKKSADGYEMEMMTIKDGETKIVPAGSNTKVIELILPAGQGGSGGIAEGIHHIFIVRFFDGVISVDVQWNNGNVQSFPKRELEDLRRFDSRVSVTGADGTTGNFIIKNYSKIIVDSMGPVINMSQNQGKLDPGNYSIVVNTTVNERLYNAIGEATVLYSGKYIFAKTSTDHLNNSLFLIDLGSYTSVITKASLSKNAEIEEQFMMAYSSTGTKRLKYAPDGATGPIETMLGLTELKYLEFGNIKLNDLTIDVIEELPILDGYEVAGIIGLDILKSARFLSLIYGIQGEYDSRLILSNSNQLEGDFTELSYTDIGRLMYVRGYVNDSTCFFIFDTGSPNCILSNEAAENTGVVISAEDSLIYFGADGNRLKGYKSKINSLRLGATELNDIDCQIGRTSAISKLGENQLGGMLGNNALSKIGILSFDFFNQVVLLRKN